MENYRDNLAQELADAPKEERNEILERAKETEEYWVKRDQHIEVSANKEESEPIDDGLGLLVKHKILYHGSGISGIESFKSAEETTVGAGLYLTSVAADAIGYGRIRTGELGGVGQQQTTDAVLYEVSLSNIRLVNLLLDENIKKVMQGWTEKLLEFSESADRSDFFKLAKIDHAKRALRKVEIGAVTYKTLRYAVDGLNTEFSEYIKSLGYEGIIALEGGEDGVVGNHDSYVIFDPSKVKVNKEQELHLSKE